MEFKKQNIKRDSLDCSAQSQSSILTSKSSRYDINDSITFAFRMTTLERNKELQEQTKIKKFQRKLKLCSTFFLFFALFILLNSCIGFSSAPFYERELSCNRVETTPACETLKAYTSVLYGFELTGSLLLVIHGMICFALADHIKWMKLADIVHKYTKIAFVIYVVIIICRIGLYLKVHYEVLKVDYHNYD